MEKGNSNVTEPHQGYPGNGSAEGTLGIFCPTLWHSGPLCMELVNGKTEDAGTG